MPRTRSAAAAQSAKEEEPTSNRPREDAFSSLSSLLQYDIDKLATVARHDAKALADLENFAEKVQSSVADVRSFRRSEEMARKKREKALKDEIDKKERVKWMKIRKQLVAMQID